MVAPVETGSWIILGLLALATVPIAVGMSRLGELFVLDVEGGKITVRRGALPKRLLNDFGDVVSRPGVTRAVLRATVENGRPMLRVAGGEVPDGQLQRLRNVLGLWTKEQIRSAAARPRDAQRKKRLRASRLRHVNRPVASQAFVNPLTSGDTA